MTHYLHGSTTDTDVHYSMLITLPLGQDNHCFTPIPPPPSRDRERREQNRVEREDEMREEREREVEIEKRIWEIEDGPREE